MSFLLVSGLNGWGRTVWKKLKVTDSLRTTNGIGQTSEEVSPCITMATITSETFKDTRSVTFTPNI